MANVTITVNNRNFTIACEEGQQERVQMLGNYINDRFASMASSGAAANEIYSLVLTSLVITDELFDLKEQMDDHLKRMQENAATPATPQPSKADMEREIETRVAEKLQAETKALQEKLASEHAANENTLAQTVDTLAAQIENVVKRLKKA